MSQQENMEVKAKAGGTATEALKKTKMSTIGVVAMIFSFVAAGAFGIEEAISSSGPGCTLIMLILFPFIWAFPLSEMVGELGSLYPTEGGIYSWGRESLGEFWGWQVGWWAGLTTWLCQAQYCALVAGYAAKIVPMSSSTEWLVKIAVVVLFTIVNIIGLDSLEKLETVFLVIVLIGFIAVTVVGFANWHHNPVTPIFNPEEGPLHSVGEGIAIIIWMYCGYECMSNMAGELENPQVIPKAMRISQPIIALSYILPTLAGVAAIGNWAHWFTDSNGSNVGYQDVLFQYVGNWAGMAFIVIAIVSNCSIFSSYIAQGSRAFFVLADDHMFPKSMCHVDKRGIPVVSILALAVFTIICCRFDFKTLVMATTPIQLYIYLLMVIVVIRLRKEYPVEGRKKMGLTIMPGGTPGLVILSALVLAVCIFALYVNGTEYFITGFVILILGLVLYMILKWVYKGRAVDDPEAYPLNPKTKLGLGDLIDIGSYVFLSGIASFVGSIVLKLYEGGYGVEYYKEEYSTGLFSNFNGMISLCRWMGIALIIIGVAVYLIGKKTEEPQLAKLQALRKQRTDQRIKDIHGTYPGEPEAAVSSLDAQPASPDSSQQV
ncbi:MAG: APC family permease [Eubacteriales bacterium]|nr:APC family permease [Eubacteriales bacterium]